jgi:FAD-linked oxidoreductase
MTTAASRPTRRGRVWRNWAGTVVARPRDVVHPAEPAEVARILAAAARNGDRVKPVGAGHSFTPVAATDGIQMALDRLRGLVSVDAGPSGATTATVAAGTTLHDVNAGLAERGLGLANMGDVDVQSVAGAISTGTHGTARDVASLSAQVVAITIALPDGRVVDASPAHRPDLYHAARLGLGALGVITAVTFRVEPAFVLHAVEEPATLDDALERLPDLEAEDHAEFYWLPFTGTVQLKRHTRIAGPARPMSRLRAWWEGDVVENAGLALVQRLTRAAPRTTPAVNRAAAALISRRDYADAAPAVFTSTRRVRFHEMEYALPREAAAPALRELRELTRRGPWRIAFPVEVRLAPADDVWLSPAYRRDTVYIAVHAYPRTEYRGWFDAVERLWIGYDGRPHWGKLHTRTAADLALLYPRMKDFLRVRDHVDPTRVMANDHLRRVLGD